MSSGITSRSGSTHLRPTGGAARGRLDFGRRVLVLRRGRIAVRLEWRSVIVCAVLAVAVACMAVLALMTGSYRLSPGQVVSALAGGETGLVHDIVVEWRAPRVAAALVFGAALGVSGAVFQSMLRNPLADPSIIGFSQGSYTGALIVILLVNGTYVQLIGGALLGGWPPPSPCTCSPTGEGCRGSG
nr:iron chelate uptake ABC transporter family permease subunit [Parafrankia sp. CH37]